MLDHASQHPEAPAVDRSALVQAEAALAWATEVGTKGPDAVRTTVPPATSAEALRALDVQVVRGYLDQLMLGRFTQDGLDALRATGALAVWLPEIDAMVGFSDGEWKHKDVWKHTKQVVWQSVPRIEVRWGALLHDIGKLKTRRLDDKGHVHFFGHSEVGAAMFRKRVAKRLAFSGHLYDRVHFLILYHLRASQYDGGWTDSAVRRFAREMGDGLTDLLDLSRADITTKRPERRKRGLRQISALASRVAEVQKTDAKVEPLPKGLGTQIISHFQLPPSKLVGDLRKRLSDEAEAGNIESHREADYYVAWLEANRDELGIPS